MNDSSPRILFGTPTPLMNPLFVFWTCFKSSSKNYYYFKFATFPAMLVMFTERLWLPIKPTRGVP